MTDISLIEGEHIVLKHKEGWTASQIGSSLGRTRNSIIGWLYRRGIVRSGDVNQRNKQHKDGRSRLRVRPREIDMALPPTPYSKREDPVQEPLHLSLLQLNARSCRWPYGEENFTFCGHQTSDYSPYCPAHTRIAFSGQR